SLTSIVTLQWQVSPKQDLIPNLTDLCYTVYTFSCLSSCFVIIIIIKHEVENEQLLIGIARFLYVSG
ncbi:hypothetical protein ACQRD4_07345, partial [Streptococcus hyointestinalis]|uniref:hypothetical protein n=1 Tax=Streptococcus hyointestinalis TaxID=1337 RepID=UPI003D04BC6B